MSLVEKSARDLLAAFRSPEPTPGGGSASALAGALGAALLAMVAGLNRPRAQTHEDLERLAAAGRTCVRLSEELTALVDRDSDAYNSVVAAYRLPRGSEAEAQTRSARVQEAMAEAIEAPLDVMRLSATAIEEGSIVAAFGNRNASSDVQVALELLAAGLRGAALNVEINLSHIKDSGFRERVKEEASRLRASSEANVISARERLATSD